MKTFFVQAGLQGIEEKWKLRFNLAFKSKGVYINLADVPDQIVPKLIDWHQELVEEENESLKKGSK